MYMTASLEITEFAIHSDDSNNNNKKYNNETT